MEALSGYVAGVLGKTFFYAGLIPACASIAFWYAYAFGLAGLVEKIVDMATTKEKLVAGAVFTLLPVLGLALALHTTRNLVLALYRTLPGPRTLRTMLVDAQRKKKDRVDEERTENLWLLSALKWCRQGFVAKRPVPGHAGRTKLSDAIAGSRQARALVEPEESPTAFGEDGLPIGGARRIVNGIAGFCACEVDPGEKSYGAECAEWRKLLYVERVRTRLEMLDTELRRSWSSAWRAASSYPADEYLQPTAIGNRLEALDDYGLTRYRCETGRIWKRLWGILPEKTKREVIDAQMEVHQFLNLSFLALLLCLGIGVTRAVEVWRSASIDWRAVVYFLAGLIAWRAFYRAAIYSCGHLTETIVASVDLHRLRLVQAMGYAVPATVEEERILFQQLRVFWAQGSGLDVGRALSLPVESKGEKA